MYYREETDFEGLNLGDGIFTGGMQKKKAKQKCLALVSIHLHVLNL